MERFVPGLSAFAAKHGFRPGPIRDYPHGDVIAVIESPDFRLKVIKDRIDLFLDVAPPASEAWFQLVHALEFIGVYQPDTDATEPAETGMLLGLVEEHYSRLQILLDEPLEILALREFEAEKGRAVVQQLRDRPPFETAGAPSAGIGWRGSG